MSIPLSSASLVPLKDRIARTVDYLKEWVLPNFFFHVTTTYALLRHDGVDLGKADYLAGAQAAA